MVGALNRILLVDDDKITNLIHTRQINRRNLAGNIDVTTDGRAVKRSKYLAPTALCRSSGCATGSIGLTCPPLRPDAPKPTSPASKTATSTPDCARCKAARSPVNPAPITATSQVMAPSSRSAGAASGAVTRQNASGIFIRYMFRHSTASSMLKGKRHGLEWSKFHWEFTK